MRFKVDENLPQAVTDLLRTSRHDALSVLDQTLGGEPDSNVYTVCQQECRVLITLDLDFADIRAYPPAESAGIVVLRLATQDKPAVLQTMCRLLPVLEQESPEHALWLVDERRVRTRR